MPTKTFRNTHPTREAAERQGIALMLSGSYVLTTLDADEYALLQRTNLAALPFRKTPAVVVTNAARESRRGQLAHLAHLSKDGRYVRYRGCGFPSHTSVVSLALIRGIAYSPNEFLARVSENETLRVRRTYDGREFTGILVGSDQHMYCSLLIPRRAPPGFDFVDIETQLNGYNARVRVSILERNPVRALELVRGISSSVDAPGKKTVE